MSSRVYDRDCPQCGPGVAGDEDGCCAGCGSTLCGAWVADLVASAAKAEAERDEIKAKAVDAIECAIRAEKDERALAYRYLAAMKELVDAGDAAFEAVRTALIRPEDEPPRDVIRSVENRVIRAENTVRRIVEEARRG